MKKNTRIVVEANIGDKISIVDLGDGIFQIDIKGEGEETPVEITYIRKDGAVVDGGKIVVEK